MKLQLIAFVFFFQNSLAQADTTVYLKEFRWTLTIPSNLKIKNTDSVIAMQNKGIKLMEGTIDKKIDSTDIVQLITAERDKANFFTANYSNSKAITRLNYDSTDEAIKLILYRTYRSNIAGNIDSTSSVITVDGIKFKKYDVNININDKLKINTSILTTFYKGYFLSVSYLYTVKEIGEEIELMLKNSKFDKSN